jgi:hypothetical protein
VRLVRHDQWVIGPGTKDVHVTRRPDEAIERESSRLADLLGRDLRLSLIS